ncbi:MAG: cysteine--tRNA ligase [Dehalococcoidia bacterium]|nr:cysteine--tRNA ligase [Dehalococcoidia bacterium]
MRIYDTLSAEKREFVPLGDVVKMYVCGITPYSASHIGHAMSYIIFDMIKRYLKFKGYKVRHVQNFTDIDDKIINRAQKLGISAKELAQKYIDEYFDDMTVMNVARADVYPLATEEIESIIAAVQAILDRGQAYVANGDVYFRIASCSEYGKLSHRTLDGMMAGARVEVDVAKEHPMDFALWKAAKPGEPSWLSPWGPGRPGWHIECSAMAMRHLGMPIDIHGGGQDLIFPHHENEIAQSECMSGTSPFVHYWLHNGLLQLGDTKMSKSVGNLITIKDLLKTHTPDALRLFVLSSHYRSPLTYSDEGVAGMERGAERLRYAAHITGPVDGKPGLVIDGYRQRFVEAMDDDFGAAQAVALLFDLAKDINRGKDEGFAIDDAQSLFKELAGVLGLTLAATATGEALAATPFVDLLVSVRSDLRKAKQFALSDQIRDRLKELNILLEDTPQGTGWKFKG